MDLTRYAIVSEDRVVNITQAREALATNWIPSDTAAIGDIYHATSRTFSPAPAPVRSITELRAEAAARITAEYVQRTQALVVDYPAAEQQSWPTQVNEAAVVQAGASTPTPWIDAAASARGLAREDLADRILVQDAAYRQQHGALTGIRQRLRDAIEAVPDDGHAAEAMEEIQWPSDSR